MYLVRMFAIVAFVLCSTVSVRAQDAAAVKSYLYDDCHVISDLPQFGGAGILVFDMNDGHQFVRRVATTVSADERHRNIKGVCTSAATGRLYFTTPEKFYCVDLVTEKTLFEVAPANNCDLMSYMLAGMPLYELSFENDTWNVDNDVSGKTTSLVETRSGPTTLSCRSTVPACILAG